VILNKENIFRPVTLACNKCLASSIF